MDYIFLLIGDLLFSLMFLFNQKFRKNNGGGIDAMFTFSMYTNGLSFVIMLIANLIMNRTFMLEITWFSLVLSILYAFVLFGYSYSSLKAFETANLSVFSIFAMLGGLCLPLVYGFVFKGEDFTVFKAICIGLIGVATTLSFEKGKKTKGNFKYYLAVFFFNGMVGVISAFQSAIPEYEVNSVSFMATVNVCAFVMCCIFHLIKNKKIPLLPIKEVGNLSCYAACSGIGNLLGLIVIARGLLDVSVQYPIITGGTMVFSTLVSIIRKEKPSVKTIVATAVAFAATLFMMF